MDLTTFTDAELTDLQAALVAEVERRRAEPLVDAARAELVTTLRDQGTLTPPEAATPDAPPEQVPAWADPGTDHTRMYTVGAVVAHAGRIWESTHPGLNHWEPGTVGVDWRIWRDITPQPEPEPGQPPAWDGQGHTYEAGDLVTHDGQTWRCLQAHSSQPDWAPGAAPSLWATHTETAEPEPESEPEGPAAWAAGTTYQPGDLITYQGHTYKVLQAHTSQGHWTPDAVASLYSPV